MITELSLEKFKEAAKIVKNVTVPTNLIYSDYFSKTTGNKVYIKPENLQFTGAYKVRGAYYKISQLTDEERAKGLITASAGNHAQGVAMAAQKFGIKATIVMPKGAPLAKVAATKSYGAEVVLHGVVYDDAYAEACRIQKETGAVFIHPFNDPYVIAGQGSIGLEIMDANPDIDTVVVPIGGGGMASGIAAAIKLLHPHVKVVGVEAAGAASMKESMMAGKLSTLTSASTIADGIAVKTPGDLTYEMCRQYVDEIVTVEEDEIAGAILTLLEKCKIVAEGAGAVSVAAVLYDKFEATGKIACVVSGGNIDVTTLQRVVDHGLMKSGRMARITTVIEDRPGHLARLLDVVSRSGANVVSIQHDRASSDSGIGVGIGMTLLELLLETSDFGHLDQVRSMMRENGYPVL